MANLKKYKVAFSMGNYIKPNYFHKILQGRAILEESHNPDFVFCGIFDQNKFLNYGDKPVRIYFYDENVFPDMNLFDYAIGFQDMSLSGRHLRVHIIILILKIIKSCWKTTKPMPLCRTTWRNENSVISFIQIRAMGNCHWPAKNSAKI